MHSLTIGFEEVPSINIDGAEGAFVDGRAEIDFDNNGTWEVSAISIELHTAQGWKLRPVLPSEEPALYCRLAETIEDRCKVRVEGDIDEYFERHSMQAAE